MWVHNVATTVMMMPVATGILQRLPLGPTRDDVVIRNFCKAVVLGVIYSAAVGGMSTLTGTGVNLILVGMWCGRVISQKQMVSASVHGSCLVSLWLWCFSWLCGLSSAACIAQRLLGKPSQLIWTNPI